VDSLSIKMETAHSLIFLLIAFAVSEGGKLVCCSTVSS